MLARRAALSGRVEALLVGTLAAAAFLASAAIASSAVGRVPHVADEIAYVFQARTLAGDRLAMEPPPLPALFGQENIPTRDDVWGARYPPGWPALLSIGLRIGAGWLVAPSLLALAVVGTWRLGRDLFDRTTGSLAAALLAVSPFALLQGASFMAHVPTLAVSTWAMVALVRATEGGRGWALVAGSLGALAFAIRPVTAVALLAPAVVFSLARRRRAAWRTAAWIALGAAPLALLWLVYHWSVFGDAFTIGYRWFTPDTSFTGARGDHVPLFAIAAHHGPWYLGQLSRSAWGWPWPDLLVLVPLLLLRGPGRRRDVMIAACVLVLVGVQSLYYFADSVYGGPRLVFEAMGGLAILAARSLGRVGSVVNRRLVTAGAWPSVRYGLAATSLGLLLLWPIGMALPDRVAAVDGWYHGVSSEVLDRLEAEGVGADALVVVGGSRSVFGSVFNANALDPGEGERVFVRDLGPEAIEAAGRAFSRSEVWRFSVVLEPLATTNLYPDRFRLVSFDVERLQP